MPFKYNPVNESYKYTPKPYINSLYRKENEVHILFNNNDWFISQCETVEDAKMFINEIIRKVEDEELKE
jgi:hypothetical protein